MILAMLVIRGTHNPPIYGFDDGEDVSAWFWRCWLLEKHTILQQLLSMVMITGVHDPGRVCCIEHQQMIWMCCIEHHDGCAVLNTKGVLYRTPTDDIDEGVLY